MGADPSAIHALYLPVEVKRLSFHTTVSDSVHCYGQARLCEDTTYCEADLWIVGDDGRIVAEIEGFMGKSITQSTDETVSILEWLYDYRWQPAPVRMKTRMPADFLPEEAALRESVEPVVDELRNWSVNREYHAVTEPEMDRLCIEYITEAFYELGLDLSEGRRFTVDEAARDMGVDEKHRQYLGRLLEVLSLHGIIENDAGVWEVQSEPARVDPGSRLARLREEHPECEREYAVLERCGKRQAAILRDRVDPIELIFQGGFDSLAELYGTSFTFEIHNRIVREVVAECMRGLPSDRSVRVLEIGAGTGGVTGYVLPELPADRAEYVFSDITRLFLRKARKRFADFDFVDYRILDIEGDIEAQGFDPDYFDIVIAANVVHATESLSATLGNVKRLMTSQGMLLIVEAVNAPHWVDISFGTTEGWWKFTDHELRPSSPLLSEATWRDLLPTAGFEHVLIFSDMSTPQESGHPVIVARVS